MRIDSKSIRISETKYNTSWDSILHESLTKDLGFNGQLIQLEGALRVNFVGGLKLGFHDSPHLI